MNLYKLHNDPDSLYGDRIKILAKEYWENAPYLDSGETYRDFDDNLRHAYVFAKQLINAGFQGDSHLEDLISTSAELSTKYAINALHGRFELGEDAIATDAIASNHYVRNIIKGRWKKGEDALASRKQTAYEYAKFINEPFPKGEEMSLKDDNSYSRRYYKRFPERKEE